MSHRTVLWLLLAGSVAAMVVAGRRFSPETEPAVEPVVRAHERPWLAPAAVDEIFAADNAPGPLFADLPLGGAEPSAETRARIAKFAQDNNVEIELETREATLVAIRFAVTYGGCCGYEAADALGRKLGRPWTEEGCPSPKEWVNRWSVPAGDHVQLRGRVRVNRVEVRWEPVPTLAQLLERAEKLIGQDRDVVREAAGDRWTELELDHLYLLEVPFPFGRGGFITGRQTLAERDDLGLKVIAERGKITGVSFVIRDSEIGDALRAAVVARWGRPRTHGEDETWQWQKKGLAIALMPDNFSFLVGLTAR